MGSEILRCHQHRRPGLDRLPFDGIDAVTGPHTGGTLKDPQVNAATAGRARLNFHLRMVHPQCVEKSVESHCLLVGLHTPRHWVEWFMGVSIVVPFQVRDGVGRHQVLEPGMNVLPCLWVGNVENLLVSSVHRAVPVLAQDPVRVSAGQIGIHVDHFRLHPETELHPQPGDDVTQWPETIRPHLTGDAPVPQSRGVVTAGTEPAVVEDESLHAHLGCPVRQLGESVEIVVEVHRLPGVEGHWSRPVGARVHRAQPAVEAVRHGVETVRPRHEQVGSGVCLSGGQGHLSGTEQFPGPECRGAVMGAFRPDAMVSRPCQVDTPHIARVEGESGLPGNHQSGGLQTCSSPAGRELGMSHHEW